MLETLEADNYHEDPHADLVMSKKIPKFDEHLETRTRSKKKERSADYYQMKFRKHILQLLEEDRVEADSANRFSYVDMSSEDTTMPYRHFCAVCGFFSSYMHGHAYGYSLSEVGSIIVKLVYCIVISFN
ncbi:hypothetical protein FQA39_LY17629 [Lamprigera yunnana]|nr:hypothetical protein FQA39_LY17629 [Lamprigera yunnana]